MKVNKEALRLVADAIEAQPYRFDMGLFFCPVNQEMGLLQQIEYFKTDLRCKTTACIAGWTIILHQDQITSDLLFNKSVIDATLDFALLKLFANSIKWKWVFYEQSWPHKYYDQYRKAEQIWDKKSMVSTAVSLLRAIANKPSDFKKHCDDYYHDYTVNNS